VHHGAGHWPALPVSREVIELGSNLPYRCKVHFSDPSELHCFQLSASQSELLDPVLAPQVHRKRRDTCLFFETILYGLLMRFSRSCNELSIEA
uniref:Uncharacterized protein n=1 Tax=Bos indicus x Bos taurus TaxID=30522 RepID=A0A4W2H1C3_BOBOX